MHACRNALAALAKPAASSGGAPGCSGPRMCSNTGPVAAASPARGHKTLELVYRFHQHMRPGCFHRHMRSPCTGRLLCFHCKMLGRARIEKCMACLGMCTYRMSRAASSLL